MTFEELRHRLLSDLRDVGVPVDEVDVYLRPFSSTYYGRYFPVYNKGDRPKIYIYPLSNKKGEILPYKTILFTGIHEMCHHLQYSDDTFVRKQGVMHDSKFWELYNYYTDRAEDLLGEEVLCVS